MLTLWAAVVAVVLRFEHDEALPLREIQAEIPSGKKEQVASGKLDLDLIRKMPGGLISCSFGRRRGTRGKIRRAFGPPLSRGPNIRMEMRIGD